MQWDELRLGIEEHGFICGTNGSGKSMLAQFLVRDPFKPYSVVYDPKHSRTLGEWGGGMKIMYTIGELYNATVEDRRIIYRPSLEEAEDRASQEAFFKWIYTQGRVRVYIDECSALLGESNPNFYLKGCLTRGRELGVSVLATTQRPVSIPLITMSEASRFYIFRLNIEEDRKRITKITGLSDEAQLSLKRYEFFYFDVMRGLHDQKLKLDLSGLPHPMPKPLFGAPSYLGREAASL